MAAGDDPSPDLEATSRFDHLKIEPDGFCWWCQKRPATTGEHKYKQTDLTRLMGDSSLTWFGDDGRRDIYGKGGIKRDRHRVIKFPKSLCAPCNNARSQPFDRAYETFSEYLAKTRVRISSGVSFEEIYGDAWQDDVFDLARYYAKHFGCRMVRSRLPVPGSLRAFLDGADDMPDTNMALVTTDSVHRMAKKGLILSSDYVSTDDELTHFTGYVMAAYVSSVGVRYQWRSDPQDLGEGSSHFFHFPMPVLNRFKTEQDVMTGNTRRPGWYARFSQWLNRPTAVDENTTGGS